MPGLPSFTAAGAVKEHRVMPDAGEASARVALGTGATRV
jgi:hypothetical protein